MASLLFGRESNRYFVRFRYGGRSFKRSLGTGNEKLARVQAGRIEETMILFQPHTTSKLRSDASRRTRWQATISTETVRKEVAAFRMI